MKTLVIAALLVFSGHFAMAQDDMDYSTTTETTRSDDGRTVQVEHTDGYKPFSITPSIQVLSFPHPLDGSVEMVFGQFIGVKLNKSFEPRFTKDDNHLKIDDKSIAIRVYPNHGSFFLGLGYGEHEAWGDRHDVINGFDTDIYAHVKSEYLTPTVGWKVVYASGFTLGFEFGWLFPVNKSEGDVSSSQDNNPLVTSNNDYQQHRDDANRAVNDFVNRGVPNIGLLELGWTF